MPNLQDVADQINARLDQIATNTVNTANNTVDIRNELVQVNGRLVQIDNTLHTGFANLSQGLYAILQIQTVALELLDHHRKQNDTVICELVNGNALLCNIVRKLGRQVALGEAAVEAVQRIEDIVERVHAEAAADADRHRALAQQIDACCPPEQQPPEACPPDCDRPPYRERRPSGQDWKPLPPPDRQPPIG